MTGITLTIGAPNTQTLGYMVYVRKGVPGTLVSVEIADHLCNYYVDYKYVSQVEFCFFEIDLCSMLTLTDCLHYCRQSLLEWLVMTPVTWYMLCYCICFIICMCRCMSCIYIYLNQCWIMISKVLWHSPDSNFTKKHLRYLSLQWV